MIHSAVPNDYSADDVKDSYSHKSSVNIGKDSNTGKDSNARERWKQQ